MSTRRRPRTFALSMPASRWAIKALPDAPGRVHRLLREDQAAGAVDGVRAYLSVRPGRCLREPPGKEAYPAPALLRLLDPLEEHLAGPRAVIM